jgi:hypothetical protein
MIRGSGRSRPGRILLLPIVALLVSCSDDDGSTTDAASTTVVTLAPLECEAREPTLRVDQIGDAVAAVEAELGGPQDYFEVNATGLLVNLFVADTDAGTATPFLYVGGELTSDAARSGATGNTFRADALTFDPQRVTSCVEAQLPTSILDVFYVVGTGEGGVRRSVVVTSASGGQLEVEVTDAGQVISVDSIDATTAPATTS